ncbi:hypothetical protein B0H13DRAFT_1961785 [Mycena leptocephala]|nr:hypothetical protein B0H13DRAFT_1961785 [Mycena leptocephala]
MAETDQLLPRPDSSAPPSNEDHLIQRENHSPHSKLLKLLFVVAIASTCRGVYMYSRCDYQQRFRDSRFSLWVEMPGGASVKMEMWTTFASAVISFISVGWWSAFGDRRGRKPVLFISLLGSVILDLAYLAFAKTPLHEDGVSIGLIIEGLLGGYPTFIGVVHAYASDVSPSSLSRTAIFGLIQAVSFIFFRCGIYLFMPLDHVGGKLGRAITVPLACANLAYIYYALPESLTPPTEHLRAGPKPVVKYIMAPFSTLMRKGPSRRKVVLLACSIFMYSWTLGFGVKMVAYTSFNGYFSVLPRWLLLIIPSVINLITWLCILPALASLVKRTYGDSEKSGRLLAKSVAQNSILIAALCVLGIQIFGGPRSSLLYGIFFFLYPFSVGALPALYSLAASYFIALGRGSELGALFGALSIWVSWGEYISYYNLNDSIWDLYYRLEWTSFFLVVALFLLVPDGPPTQFTEMAVDQGQEGAV